MNNGSNGLDLRVSFVFLAGGFATYIAFLHPAVGVALLIGIAVMTILRLLLKQCPTPVLHGLRRPIVEQWSGDRSQTPRSPLVAPVAKSGRAVSPRADRAGECFVRPSADAVEPASTPPRRRHERTGIAHRPSDMRRSAQLKGTGFRVLEQPHHLLPEPSKRTKTDADALLQPGHTLPRRFLGVPLAIEQLNPVS